MQVCIYITVAWANTLWTHLETSLTVQVEYCMTLLSQCLLCASLLHVYECHIFPSAPEWRRLFLYTLVCCGVPCCCKWITVHLLILSNVSFCEVEHIHDSTGFVVKNFIWNFKTYSTQRHMSQQGQLSNQSTQIWNRFPLEVDCSVITCLNENAEVLTLSRKVLP